MMDTLSARLQLYLTLGGYPLSKAALIERTQEHGADASVLALLEHLPDQHYDSFSAVEAAIIQYALPPDDENAPDLGREYSGGDSGLAGDIGAGTGSGLGEGVGSGKTDTGGTTTTGTGNDVTT